ncbi:MAG: hypothetical protein ACXVI1_03710 [Halobacteriota archaeon]
MPTREEMINEVVQDYKHDPLYHDVAEFQMRLEFYQDVKEIKAILEKIVEKIGKT